jgi:hypothetical protein
MNKVVPPSDFQRRGDTNCVSCSNAPQTCSCTTPGRVCPVAPTYDTDANDDIDVDIHNSNNNKNYYNVNDLASCHVAIDYRNK